MIPAMSFTRRVTTRIDIAAAPENVYAVLTNLEAYEQWNLFIVRGSGTFALQATPAGTRLTQSETSTGLLVPLFARVISRTRDDFARLNAAQAPR